MLDVGVEPGRGVSHVVSECDHLLLEMALNVISPRVGLFLCILLICERGFSFASESFKGLRSSSRLQILLLRISDFRHFVRREMD